jgi:DNA-binding NtrC family response regulator
MSKILIVDDEPNIVKVLKTVLERAGYEITGVASGKAALKELACDEYDLMICDLRLGKGMDGLELLQEARQRHHSLTVIMITAYGTVDVAVEAMKEGAYDFVCKPFKLDALMATVKNAFHYRETSRAGCLPAEPAEADDIPVHYETLVGESPAMQEIYRLIERVGRSEATVLIQGESGTGKELVARAIHQCSPRASGPWVPLNCAALSATLLESEMFGHAMGAFTGATKTRDGLFLAANKGTLFLDEVAAMDLGVQSKFLRALQERKVKRIGENKDIPVDVRVIAATNEPLERMRDNGEFREDLYYRISVIPIRLPPLRQRTEDIPHIARKFCRLQSDSLGMAITLSAKVISVLMAYSWPGNVRELQNAMACAATLCQNGKITIPDLPPHIRGALEEKPRELDEEAGLGKSLREFLRLKEREYLEQILRRTGGNRVRAAELLGISRATLYRKLPED